MDVSRWYVATSQQSTKYSSKPLQFHAAVPYILHILSLKRGSQFSWTTKQIKAERIKLMGSRPLQRLSQDSKQQRKIEVTHFQVVQ